MTENTIQTSPAGIQEYHQKGWRRDDLLPSGDEAVVNERLSALDERVSELEAWRERLSADLTPADFVELLRLYEDIVERIYVLSAYGQLWFSEDTQSQAALTFRNRVEHAMTGIQNRTLFLTLWWKSLEEADAERLLGGLAEVPDFRHFLADLRRFRPFTLEESSEKIVNLKDANGIQAVLTIYSMLANRLEFTLEIDGESQTLTRDEINGYAFSPDAEVRRSSYDEFFRVYEGEAKILSQIYVHRVRDWDAENRELRGFPEAISVRNMANDLPDPAVATLLDTVEEQAEVFQRYFRLKAKWLGNDKLSRYDLYAPLSPSDRRIEYVDAVRTVLETLYDFNEDFGRRAERVFQDDHVDSEVRKGKRGGAFCMTVLPSQTPWLLANYNGRVRDVATLAHELGHAVHSLLAEDHSVLTQHATLPLAETASVFSEILLTDRLLKQESDPTVRRELLSAALDDAYATVVRQTNFVRFESRAHREILDGRSPEELNEIYLDIIRRQFGDAVDVPDVYRWEWVTIPHIYHSPFYCYAYSFGQLLVLALYRRYQELGEAFVPGYLRMLAHGGSARPIEILSEVGIDPADAAFWRSGFEVLSGMMDELEALG